MNAAHPTSRVDIVLLAAGPSTRMGSPKQSLRFGESSVVRHLTREALASTAQSVTVVTGAWADLVRHELGGLPARLIHNEDWEKGMASSLRRGIRSLPHNTDACLVMLCDQPLISRFSLNRIIDAYRSGPHTIVASGYSGIAGVPVLYDHMHLSRLEALSGDEGARTFLRATKTPILTLPVPEAALDLDTPEDYAAFVRSVR